MITFSISDQKRELRQRCKTIRKELSDATRQRASQAICVRLAAWDVFQASDAILAYMPIYSEVDLRPLLVGFPGKRWLLPRLLPGENGRMVFHTYDPDNLIMHRFGMAEPASHLPQVPPEDIQLVLTPGLAFDRSGWRLGYGGGYYDRFLAKFDGVSAGIVYQALLLNTLPHARYDLPVDWLATEEGIFPATRNQSSA